MASVCDLRDMGIVDNELKFYDSYINMHGSVEKEIFLRTLIETINGDWENFMVTHSIKSSFPWNLVYMTLRDFKQKIKALKI